MEVELMLLCVYILKKISVVCREIPALSVERMLSCGLLLTQPFGFLLVSKLSGCYWDDVCRNLPIGYP
jgi:hypothetical protein